MFPFGSQRALELSNVAVSAEFMGDFDLYFNYVPGLLSAYQPKGVAVVPDFKNVLGKIKDHQSKGWYSARISIPSKGRGYFLDPEAQDLVIKVPVEPMCLINGSTCGKLDFAADESIHAATAGAGPGYQAAIELYADYDKKFQIRGVRGRRFQDAQGLGARWNRTFRRRHFLHRDFPSRGAQENWAS
jgi:hypothetical protein